MSGGLECLRQPNPHEWASSSTDLPYEGCRVFENVRLTVPPPLQPFLHKLQRFAPLTEREAQALFEAAGEVRRVDAAEPPRVFQRLQLLRDWSHDESQDIPEVFRRSA